MKVKALRRPNPAGRTTTQLTHAGRSRRQLPNVRPVTGRRAACRSLDRGRRRYCSANRKSDRGDGACDVSLAIAAA